MGSSPRVRGRQRTRKRVGPAFGLIPASAGQTPLRCFSTTPRRAHPRECGADPEAYQAATATLGSSPRVRGRRGVGVDEILVGGLIPASAGQTTKRTPEDWSHAGSSPRVRGRRSMSSSSGSESGLIPASAGQTNVCATWRLTATAHPRECGADCFPPCGGVRLSGSSPRVRGRLGRWFVGRGRGGLIPASAGQTEQERAAAEAARAHPRECGADCTATEPLSIPAGSSPRVRGRPRCSRGVRLWAGLIPASAGQTSGPPGPADASTAHPRECGADPRLGHARQGLRGSSPRVRGRLWLSVLMRKRKGLIPASAGQTRSQSACPAPCGAHPRECGADRPGWVDCQIRPGSSPRVRGRPLGGAASKARERLIPASAGQTPVWPRSLLVCRAHPRECGADFHLIRVQPHTPGSSPRVRGRPFATSNAAPIERVKEPTSSSHF